MTTPLHETLANARKTLLAERNASGHWEGELSTSALSTATSIVALGTVDPTTHRATVARACEWLVAHRNPDGGWGDTTKSFSNISTTLLCWSALTRFGGGDGRDETAVKAAESWIREYVGSLDPRLIAETVKARYGKDRTFSVPILMLCAICGSLGPKGWKLVLPLPFRLAVFPRSWFATLRLPVVSYALPALIAIGYARSRQGGGPGTPLRKPSVFWPRLSALLTSIQPASGGFLEAAPLTGFVTMALVAAGETNHPVVKKGVEFLLRTVRPDGSWPIDTNLATWATTLAVKALAIDPPGATEQEGEGDHPTLFDGQEKVLNWLLRQQYRDVHPFTASPPGGWAWTDLSGGVPDADDTPGALLALSALDPARERADVLAAAAVGVSWLLDLQNRDGGIPTFCRGWGALPFDRSSPDLTAHTLRAWHVWRPDLPATLRERIDLGVEKAEDFLEKQRRPDGSWSPLWFGNQHRFVDEENPSYGTAKVVLAFLGAGRDDLAAPGLAWLRNQQNADGGWGALRDRTPSTIEETALAMSALAGAPADCTATDTALARGERWLREATKNGTIFEPSPIGFYFARLWYFEKTYPVVWTVEALSRLAKRRA